jgi:hypothetical protein
MRRIGTVLVVVLLIMAAVGPAAADPPDDSGAVERFGEQWFWGTDDYEHGWFVFLGFDIRDWACGEGAPDDVVMYQNVDVPSNADRIVTTMKGEVRTSVWSMDADFCSDAPLAEGMSSVVMTDNDFFAWDYATGPNANSFGISAHGKLLGPDGETLVFSMHDRIVWDGDDFSTFKNKIKVSLH